MWNASTSNTRRLPALAGILIFFIGWGTIYNLHWRRQELSTSHSVLAIKEKNINITASLITSSSASPKSIPLTTSSASPTSTTCPICPAITTPICTTTSTPSAELKTVPIASESKDKNKIPEKHWQIWRINIADLEPTELERMRTWRHLNPFHRYELFSHDSAETFVRKAYTPSRPDIVAAFLGLRDMILRADFLRYLVLYHEGGVYSDIDTKALKPIKSWIPYEYRNSTNVLLGLEIDEPNVMWADWADNFVFCQSTMMAAPGHRIFEILIDNIIAKLSKETAKQKKELSQLVLTFQDVLRITGPVAFTNAVFQFLTEVEGRNVTRADFSGIRTGKRMADVVILPTVAFVPGQPHSHSGEVSDEGALVQHMGMGSWRDTHKFDGEAEEEERKAKEEKEKLEKEKFEKDRKQKEEKETKEKEQRQNGTESGDLKEMRTEVSMP